MKHVLGLDLGSASIGWALICEYDNSVEIINMGSRIIPYEGTEGKDFSKGTGETRNSIRTKARTIRKGYDRYQQRRKFLIDTLEKNGMLPTEEVKNISKMQLWELRSKAVTEEISKPELGRILLWLNQKRGYKSSRSDANLGKKDTEYVAEVKNNHQLLREQELTIGQYFYKQLLADNYFRVKDRVFPREAYLEEFDAICKRQSKLLSQELAAKIRNEIIYHQRLLKSQKGLVAVCDFEGFWKKKDGKAYFVGPKVAPKSSPLFQVEKIWESINNIKITNRKGEEVLLTLQQKQRVFAHLDENEKLTTAQLFAILGLNKKEYVTGKQLERGLQGNLTKVAIKKCLQDNKLYETLLRFDLTIDENAERFGYLYDRKTGEIKNEKRIKIVTPLVEKEPLYELWHTIYSINEEKECIGALQHKFALDIETATKLANIDFNRLGFSNKSAKLIRKILPYLMEGDTYDQAMSYAGHDHSNSLTTDENLKRNLLDTLKQIPKKSLRQPIVEKILNQMVNLINSLIEQYSERDETGKISKYFKFDEIRIELARELKQSREERNQADKNIRKREQDNKEAIKNLAEHSLRATRNNILKWRLYHEINGPVKKLNAICIYCGQPICFTNAILGHEVEVEHIIPKSKLFDDSQSNKTLAHRRCNATKGNMTAYDFMKTKPVAVFEEYVNRVNMLYSNHVIPKAKRDKLLMTEENIPDNFIDRQLRESQYIARKAREVLQSVCYNVWSTTGVVTAELRRLWGWEDVTMNLQMPKYKQLGMTEFESWESEHGRNKHTKEKIAGWTKRDDHRHHAIDALVVACTKQGFIQRFNTLNSQKTREDMEYDINKCSIQYRDKLSFLEKYIVSNRPLEVNEVEKAVGEILVSFKPGKKVAVKGKRTYNKKVVQTGIIVPRGALSEESVYGKIRVIGDKKNLKYLVENPELIVDRKIKELIEERLALHQQDKKETLKSLKKHPIYIDQDKTVSLDQASCYKTEYVIKYTVDTTFNKVDKVVDEGVKEILKRRLAKFGNNPKEAFKDVLRDEDSIPWYVDEQLDRPIRYVRCLTGLAAVVSVKKNAKGEDIGYVKPGNNHHIAIYVDEKGGQSAFGCTFWHAVERKKYGLPVVIRQTNAVWDVVLTQTEELPQTFLEKLPPVDLDIVVSLQQNEMFVMGLSKEDVDVAIQSGNKKQISDHLYRVQKMSIGSNGSPIDIYFRHHLETQLIDDANAKESKRFIRVQSLGVFFSYDPCKVRIDCLGNIVGVGV